MIPFKEQKGFTLIELLVVISIIGLLSSIVLAAVSTARSKAAVAAGQSFDDNTYHAFGAAEVAEYNFDEGTGNIANDNSGNHNTLTAYAGSGNISWNTINKMHGASAVNFSPSGAFFSNPGITGIDKSNGSVSFWVDLNSASAQQTIFTIGQNGFQLALRLVYGTSPNYNLLYLYSGSGGGVKTYTNIPASTIVGKWTNIVISWNVPGGTPTGSPSAAGTVNFYINGSQVSTNSGLYNNGWGLYDMVVGAEDTGGDNRIDGTVDDFRIYTQSLQTAQAEEIYAEGAPAHGLAVK